MSALRSVFGGPKRRTACVGASCTKSQVGSGSGVLSRGARRPVNRPFFFSFCFLGLRVCALWHTNATCRRGANSHKAEMTKRHRNKKNPNHKLRRVTVREGSHPEETPTKRHPHRESKQQRKTAIGCWGRFASPFYFPDLSKHAFPLLSHVRRDAGSGSPGIAGP